VILGLGLGQVHASVPAAPCTYQGKGAAERDWKAGGGRKDKLFPSASWSFPHPHPKPSWAKRGFCFALDSKPASLPTSYEVSAPVCQCLLLRGLSSNSSDLSFTELMAPGFSLSPVAQEVAASCHDSSMTVVLFSFLPFRYLVNNFIPS
jgi:hypothetical protein